MKGDRPIFWNQGLFLYPQHFQAADDAAAAQVEALRRYALPYFWGVHRLTFYDTDIDHFLSVERLEAIFQSGAILNVPMDASLAPLTFDKDWPQPNKVGIVYLALALPKSGGANAAAESETFAGKRYVYAEEPETMADKYGTAAPSPIQRLKLAPILVRDVDIEQYADFEHIPIVAVQRRGEHIDIVPQFLPPLLSLDASQQLMGMLRTVQDSALACAGRLAGYKTSVTADVADIRFVLNFTALGIVNRTVPALVHILATSHTHPWYAYGVLRVFAGELSTLYEDMDCLGRTPVQPNGIMPYDHTNLYQCFESLCGLILSLLDNMGLDESRVLPLVLHVPYFSADIPQDFISSTSRYWLWIHSTEINDNMANTLPNFIKMSAKDNLNMLIAKAVSGIPLRKEQSAPPGFLKRQGSHWYSIDTSHLLWQTVITEQRISLFWEGAPEGVEVKLVATGR